MAKGALLILFAEALLGLGGYLYNATPKNSSEFRVSDWVTFWVSVAIGGTGVVTALYVFLGR